MNLIINICRNLVWIFFMVCGLYKINIKYYDKFVFRSFIIKDL